MPIITVKKTHPGSDSRAIFKTIVVTVPKANTTRKTLKASTLPGNTLPINAPVFVCKKVSAIPQSTDTKKHRPYFYKKKQSIEAKAASSTITVPTIESLYLQKGSKNLFKISPVIA